MPCVINAYSSIPAVHKAVAAGLVGEAPFTAISPVDATCGLPHATD